MEAAQIRSEELQQALTRFLTKYQKRGFNFVARDATSVQLSKPARFPRWFFKEDSRLIHIDNEGTIFVSKIHY